MALLVALVFIVCSFRPAGFTPDPLDYAFCWHLLGVLGALGTLPPAADNLPEGEGEVVSG